VSREHATWRATALAWPLLFLLALHSRNWDDPLLVFILVAFLAIFILYIWAMLKVERQLNTDGQSLFYPWRVKSTRKETRRIDGVLSTIIIRLQSGEDEAAVLSTLRLHLEGVLPREAAGHYSKAVDRLIDATRRDWVFDAERREASLKEAERELLMTRVEYLKEMTR
jgi:Ca2+/Na+ antiporter